MKNPSPSSPPADGGPWLHPRFSDFRFQYTGSEGGGGQKFEKARFPVKAISKIREDLFSQNSFQYKASFGQTHGRPWNQNFNDENINVWSPLSPDYADSLNSMHARL